MNEPRYKELDFEQEDWSNITATGDENMLSQVEEDELIEQLLKEC